MINVRESTNWVDLNPELSRSDAPAVLKTNSECRGRVNIVQASPVKAALAKCVCKRNRSSDCQTLAHCSFSCRRNWAKGWGWKEKPREEKISVQKKQASHHTCAENNREKHQTKKVPKTAKGINKGCQVKGWRVKAALRSKVCVVAGLPSFSPASFPLAPSLNLVASIYWHKATQQIKQQKYN